MSMIRVPTCLTKSLVAAALLVVLGGAAPPPPPPPQVSNDAPSHSGMFRVGKTGILCYKEPCPRRGIVPVDTDEPRRWRPIWSGDTPPSLQGNSADRRRITSAWADGGCLIVEGAFMQETLHVRQIRGTC